jgi:probable lipoprotein NlpC
MIVTAGYFGSAIGSSTIASAATPQSLDLIDYGKDYIGTPYRYGAPAGVEYVFDCSSFVQHVFSNFGIELPRTSISMYYTGEKVDDGSLSVGDLVFFKSGGSGVGHVAIYAGNGKILHASSSNGVTISSLSSSYWQKNYVGARRIL